MLQFFFLLVAAQASAPSPKPAPRKMHCVCCVASEGPLLGGGYGAYCGAGVGPNDVTFSATASTYQDIGARLCAQGMVDQSQQAYVSDCGYVQ